MAENHDQGINEAACGENRCFGRFPEPMNLIILGLGLAGIVCGVRKWDKGSR
jgi:hypothetical protein